MDQMEFKIVRTWTDEEGRILGQGNDGRVYDLSKLKDVNEKTLLESYVGDVLNG